MRIIHIADVHWRGLSRHEEYILAFKDFFKKAKALNPDIIYIGGDIVHSKTQGISPELIQCLAWWFNEMAKVAPTHVILGNHDGLILNKDRQDAVSPIIKALNNPNIYLYKNSGNYEIPGHPGFYWNVFSCFDEDNWNVVSPVPNAVNIALYHGAISHSKTDTGWSLTGDDSIDIFDNYDYALLGDIHKAQFLTHDKKIAYCGSTIQQNYGEDLEKGFLLWDIRGKDDFDVKFYSVEQPNPFATITWNRSVKEVIEKASEFPDYSRFRIKSSSKIDQADIKQISGELKEKKKAKEIVYKIDNDFNSGVLRESSHKMIDLRNEKNLTGLFNDYFANISEKSRNKISELVPYFLNQSNDLEVNKERSRNINWTLKKMSFSNTYGYGKNNVIDLGKIQGITGIFGRNRCGKSSIIGTIMYCLFNGTDRGSIKNLHVINSRKGSCKAELVLEINSERYKIVRSSKKTQPRKNGPLSSHTQLEIYQVDEEDNILRDMSDEQRRSTEKILRKMIGTSEDFLMTSFASQGEMNSFIKEKSTARKIILSKFLDLEVFREMEDLAKSASYELRSQIKMVPDREWDQLIVEKEKDEKEIQLLISKIQENIKDKRDRSKKLSGDIKVLQSGMAGEIVTLEELKAQETLCASLKSDKETLEKKIETMQNELSRMELKLEKIKMLKKQFPIEDLKEKKAKKAELDIKIETLNGLIQNQKQLIKIKKRSISKLEGIPCGDQFPKCKFIKDSIKDKDLITEIQDEYEKIKKESRGIKKIIDKICKDRIDESIERYENVLKNQNKMKMSKATLIEKIKSESFRLAKLTEQLINVEKSYNDMKARYVPESSDQAQKIKSLVRNLSSIESDIKKLEKKKMDTAFAAGRLVSEKLEIINEKEKYNSLKEKLKTYDYYIEACSGRGIPFKLLEKYIPVINLEISKILQDNVGFTVELEANSRNNTIETYIDYGDSKRLIELASGMEKMMASIAIRVALISMSSLPKSDIFIIDEGFGALDPVTYLHAIQF